MLAYSTVSQLGFMFIGVGVGAYWAGVFHLMTHAFFKACLFLGSGSVIHGMHAVEHDQAAAQDMRNMGGLKRVMPLTARTYLIACLAITAAPIPLFAGFWSKDEILWKAFNTENIGAVPGALIYGMGLAAARGTSFYMWRSYFLTFEGQHAKPEIADKVHESPAAMTYVLAVLAFLRPSRASLFGFSTHLSGADGEPLLEAWLQPVLAHAEVRFAEPGLALEYGLMALSVGLALLPARVARAALRREPPHDWAAREATACRSSTRSRTNTGSTRSTRATFIAGVLRLRLVLADIDRWVVDGFVNGAACSRGGAPGSPAPSISYLVDGAVNFVAEGMLAGGQACARCRPAASRTTCTASSAGSRSSPSSSTSSPSERDPRETSPSSAPDRSRRCSRRSSSLSRAGARLARARRARRCRAQRRRGSSGSIELIGRRAATGRSNSSG